MMRHLGAQLVLVSMLLVCVVVVADSDGPNLNAGAAAHEATLGDKSIKSGLINDALSHFDKAIELGPTVPDYRYKKAVALMGAGRNSAARSLLDMAISMDDSQAKYYYKRARVSKALGNYERCLEDYNTVLKIDPGNAKATKELGQITEAKKSWDSGVALFKNNEKRNNPNAFRQALDLFGKVMQVSPDAVEILVLMTQCQMKLNDYVEVIATTGRILKIRPDNLEAFLLRGKAYLYINEPDLAMRHFKEGHKSDPDHAGLKTEYKRLKKFNKIVGKIPELDTAHKWDEAIQEYNSALEIMSEPEAIKVTLDIHLKVCQTYVKLGERYNRKVKTEPQAKQKGIEAYESCEKVVNEDGGNIEAILRMGDALILQQKFDAAVRHFKLHLGHNQNNMELRQGLDKAEKLLKKSEMKDYYKELGVAKDADTRSIEKAYRKLAKQYHPDRVHGEEEKAAAEVKFMEIAEAYEVLSDDELRGKYDRGEDLKPQGGGGGGGMHNPFGFKGGNQHFQFHFR